MRNALICAGVMLAMLLLWPLVFGGAGSAAKASQKVHAASTVTMAIPKAVIVRPAARIASASPVGAAGTTCYRHYEHVFNACQADGIAACRRQAIDGWDVCEATGSWPD